MPDGFSILPSHYRKAPAGEQQNESALWEVDEAPRRLNPTILAMASQCLLRGLWKARGEKGIGPSPFTQSVMDDGKEYETRLMDESGRPIWIRAIQQALDIDLPENMPQRPCADLRMSRDESPEAYANRARVALEETLPKTPSEAFFLHEPCLAIVENGVLIQGKPDLMIWTGKQWIIADIKCSEEARRTHGMQIATYARVFRNMRPGKNPKIHPQAVVIHCAPGYRYTKGSSGDIKTAALQHTQATAFPMESITAALDEALATLSATGEEVLQQAIDQAVFSSVCVECEFRLRCYPRFLRQGHVSLAPLMTAETAAIMASGIRSIGDLIAAIDDPLHPAHSTLLDLKDGSRLQLGYLREKAERIREKGFYSKWRAAPAEVATPLLFVAVGGECAFSPPLDRLHDKPTCLVVYTEQERRIAWAKIFAAGKKGVGVSTFVLAEIFQQSVHGPLPSLTLRPLAAMLGKITSFGELATHYPDGGIDIPTIEKAIADSATVAERLRHLQCVWNFLQSAQISFSLPPANPHENLR